MKTFSDKTQDFFYDMIDYIIIIVVIVCVVGIINWRLDVVFDKKITKVEFTEKSNSSEVIEAIESSEINSDPNEQPITVSIDISNPDTSNVTNEALNDQPIIKSVIVPSGSSSQQIGQILLDAGIISDIQVFLTRAAQLHLDTKLQSGTFDLDSSMNLDLLIKKIAGRS